MLKKMYKCTKENAIKYIIFRQHRVKRKTYWFYNSVFVLFFVCVCLFRNLYMCYFSGSKLCTDSVDFSTRFSICLVVFYGKNYGQIANILVKCSVSKVKTTKK